MMPMCSLSLNEVIVKLAAGWVLKGVPDLDQPFRLFDPYADAGWNLQVPADDVRKMIDDNVIVETRGRFASNVRSYSLNSN